MVLDLELSVGCPSSLFVPRVCDSPSFRVGAVLPLRVDIRSSARFQSNLLNSRSHCHVLFLGSPAVKVAVEPRSADLGQLAHSLDTQTALQRHLEFRRRRLLARDVALLASSLDFLLGTSEKIHLHCFVRQ